MRIALLGTRGIPANYGGFETFAEELSVRLAERGWLAEDGPGLFTLPRRDAQDASYPPPGGGQAGSSS